MFVAVLGGVKVANGNMTLGDVQAFLQYTTQFSQPITQLASLMNTIQSTVASAERVFEVLDEEEMSNEKSGLPEEKIHHTKFVLKMFNSATHQITC